MEIEIKSLSKTFDSKKAIDIPYATIENGEIVGLVGNNGAGKTTLFRLMLDLLKADTGEVVFKPEGEAPNIKPINPATSEDWKAMTGAYMDSGFLIDFLTPEEYFEFIGNISGLDKKEIYRRLDDFIPFMAGEILNQKKYIRDLSAGNKQKTGIIAALLTYPQLVVLDEPFNFLDPSSQNHLKKMLAEYNRQRHATILISSHNLQHTTDISTRIMLLEHGKIIKNMDNTNCKAETELEEYFNA